MLDTAARIAFDQDHDMFRDTVRKVFAKALLPNLDRFETEGAVDRPFWRACGEAGLLCPTVKEENGGPGLDFAYNAVVAEELAYAGSSAGITLQSDIVAEYIEKYGSPEQRRNFSPAW